MHDVVQCRIDMKERKIITLHLQDSWDVTHACVLSSQYIAGSISTVR